MADIVLSTEAIVVISGLLAGLAGAISLLFKMLIATKDAQLKNEREQRKSYQNMTEEALDALDEKVVRHIEETGTVPAVAVAPVLPEHSSPPTTKQESAADLATSRARLVAAKLALSDTPSDEK